MTRPLTPTTIDTRRASRVVSVVEITDPAAVGEGVAPLEQEGVQLSMSPFRSLRVLIRLRTSILLYQSTNQPIRTRTKLRGGLTAYVAFGPRAAGTVSGLPIRPDRVLACPSGVKLEFVVEAGYESVTLLVPPDDVRSHLRWRRREVESLIPSSFKFLRTSPGAAARLFEWGRDVADAAAKDPDVFEESQTNAHAQVELMDVLLASVESAVEADAEPRESTRLAYSRVVQAAEDYALQHADQPLYVAHLCKAASVSERTLQNAFKEIMGMTPVTFLTRLRLHQVRRALRTASPHSTTVTAEARKHGSGTSASSPGRTEPASATCRRTRSTPLSTCSERAPKAARLRRRSHTKQGISALRRRE